MRQRNLELHITSTEVGEVTWRLAETRILVERIAIYGNDTPAYRLRMDGSYVLIPNADDGVVYLGEGDERPELPQLREWFTSPDLLPLWSAVDAKYWDLRHPGEPSRLEALDVPALDYVTSDWDVAEIREILSNARQ
ncbi:hypothetical protein ACWDYH_12140 [Nocardia goodfellowii]